LKKPLQTPVTHSAQPVQVSHVQVPGGGGGAGAGVGGAGVGDTGTI